MILLIISPLSLLFPWVVDDNNGDIVDDVDDAIAPKLVCAHQIIK
jgi:hypothetical protein